ncbi:SHOCT domain-containing protein [Rhodoferax sp. BAB1]|uniref:SHOCT domain-containing protein n=1 Tax=Rhodoferax sp. BAB1 TaxID=2741720 RepID=UPI0015777279|nr:SHOCT domain-containing protein [Rhodoferax sp. BAB1]QKO23404.1 SHOCT domain-containing protein [Rhodoferax sp. BAB1]
MYFDHGYYMGGMHALWWVFWLILVVALVYTGWSPQRRAGRRERESPHELLQRRLARGEITPEAYEQAKTLLDRDTGTH